MSSFKVLMWKYYTVRKRRFIQTLVEFVGPVITVIVFFLLKDAMMKKHPLPTTSFNLFQKFSEETTPRILITPDSGATRKLMRHAYENMGRSRSVYTGSLSFTSPPRQNTNITELQNWDADIVVAFENMTGSSIPDKLNYTIGLKSSLETGVPVLRRHKKIESFKEPLLRLQWAIDSSFIKLKTGVSPKLQNIRFEQLTDSFSMRAVNYMYVNSVFYLFPYVFFLAPLFPFIFLMTRLLEERSTGIQELIKMVGVTPHMLGITQFLNSLPSCLLFSLLTTYLFKHGGDNAMIPATSHLLIFLGVFLHMVTIVALAYPSSFLAKDAQYTVSLSLFVYIGLWVPVRLMGQESKSAIKLFFKGLFPHCPNYWFLNNIHNTEVYYQGIGISFDNWDVRYGFFKSGGTNGSTLVSYLMQLLQIFIFFTMSWYLERVLPGKYGIALPWNFFCQKEYWSWSHNIRETTSEELSHDPTYDQFFEELPTNMEVGLKISNVSKIYGSGKKQFQALDNVSLDIFRGEITVLLGHNGAGKTTLISIITGMINPTSGKIYVKGMDTVTQQVEVRKHLGLCPQHNLFFPDLTVAEHFMFFSMIKGGTFQEAKKSSYALMQQLDLTHKANRKTAELSGGMLRRMQLGCALCGNASVLILDEPTSGLDVEARRELWDMLLALRGDRTLVLTTHFMEEADVLGDRIAALHAGKLKCHATPMFLKRAVGSGFRLSITTIGTPNEAKIAQRVREMVPRATLKQQSNNTLLYELPAGSNLPSVFQDLEKRKVELDIETLSVGITTLEEVFLELCCDVDTADVKMDDSTTIPVKYVHGCTLIRRQMRALFLRQFEYTMSKKTAFVVLQVILPFIMCTALTELFNNIDISPYRAHALSFDLYSDDVTNKAMFRLRENGIQWRHNPQLNNVSRRSNETRRINTIETIMKSKPNFKFENIDDSNDPKIGNGNSDQFIVDIDFNETDAKIVYKPSVGHSATVGLNILSNIMALQRMDDANGRSITTQASNIKLNEQTAKVYVPKTKMNCSLFAIFNIFILIATAINDVTLPCRERLTVARHTHVMAGCPPTLYWLTTFLYHMFGFMLFSCTATLCACAFMDYDKTIDDKETLVAYTVVVILCGMDFYVFAYFVSYYFHERGTSLFLIGVTIIFGFLSPILMIALDFLKSKDEPEPIFNRIMSVLGAIIPPHTFTDAVIRMTDTSRFNSFCKHNIAMCPSLPPYSEGFEGFESEKCCKEGSATQGPYNHFALSKYAMGWHIIFMAIQFVTFATLVILLEHGFFNRLWNYVGRLRARDCPEKQFDSPQVVAEKEYVDKTIVLPKDQIVDSLLICNAWKIYYKLCGKKTFALRDANFSLKNGECFGLLGCNGAGKTTTFKLISNDEAATKGNIYVNGYFLSSDPSQYMRCLGYCPQFCGLDDFRSGFNNLRMLLILRGFSNTDVRRETAAWLAVVGMSQHGHRAVAGYSGGMVRRLATAAALCSGSPVTLMDEPTAGVDTAARRLLWVALKRGTLNNRAIVLTSHSIDEMEMLCKRVTILNKGEMCAFGTPAALREEFAPGNSIALKLRVSVVQSPLGPERVQHLKDSLVTKFECTLKDEHLTSLQYRVNEKIAYSELFAKMDAIAVEFNDVLEDFSVADTTLEDVFLYFANN